MTNAQLHGCKYEGWECFHCGEVFTTVGAAEDHFGGTQGALTGCQIKAGDERGLLMELRIKEAENAVLKMECSYAETVVIRLEIALVIAAWITLMSMAYVLTP